MMKKLLLMMLTAVAVLTSCKKDDPVATDLVQDVALPPLTEQFAVGESVTIKGVGFTTIDQTVFRIPAKATTDIEATITEVTSTHITFTVPAGLSAGENTVILKRGAAEQLLGNITIKDVPPAKLYGFGWRNAEPESHGNYNTVYEIDRTTGKKTLFATFPDYKTEISYAVVDGHIAYGLDWSESEDPLRHLVTFNFDTKEYKQFPTTNGIEFMGMINGKVHAITAIGGEIVLHTIDPVTCALTLVTNFGKVDNPEDLRSVAGDCIAYDAKTKTILITGDWKGAQDYETHVLALNMESKIMVQIPDYKLEDPKIMYFSGFLFVGNYRYALVSKFSRGDGDSKTEYDIFTINDKFELDKKAATIPYSTQSIHSFNPQSYDAQADVMYVTTYDEITYVESVSVIDVKTFTYKAINSDDEVGEVVLVQ